MSNANGYCDDHQSNAVGWVQRKSAWRGKGSTRAQRKERELVLRRDNYLCVPCLSRGIYSPAQQVDHIVNLASGGADTMENKQSICDDCHKRKTALESARAKGDQTGGVGKSLEPFRRTPPP